MKTVFAIGNRNDATDCLFMEIGQGHCCYALLQREARSFSHLTYISFDGVEAEENMEVVLREIEMVQGTVVVSSAFVQALLMPQKKVDNAALLLNTVYGLPLQKQFTDKVNEWQTDVVYSMPDSIYQKLVAKFGSIHFFHTYTPALKIYNGFVAEDQIDVHFTPQQFRVIVKKENAIQLVQTYSYKSPLDVVYYLLKICIEAGLDQSVVFVVLSGLIDKDSAMYAELHNYFVNLHFAQGPSYSLPENGHPHHYFTSLYNLAACAS